MSIRIKIDEALKAYNKKHKKNLLIKDVAKQALNHRKVGNAVKATYLSQMNTGKKEATVSDLVSLGKFFKVDISKLV